MKDDGVEILFQTKPMSFDKKAGGEHWSTETKIEAKLESYGEEVTREFNAVMFCTGRRPNVENLGLESAGVDFDKFGVKVDEYLQTSNPNVYAVGDCIPGF